MKGLFPSTAVLTVQVAVPLPVTGLFSYSLPAGWQEKAQAGVRVRVPFKNRELVGYLVSQKEVTEEITLKPVLEILDDAPVLSPAMLELTRWISQYYGSSWGEAIENALPKWVKYGKKAVRAMARGSVPTLSESGPKKMDYDLSRDQRTALDAMMNALSSAQPKPILLFGVTGSGKSEIYTRAIQEVLRQNRSAICLVPEIALTEQLRLFFLHHFGNNLEILHSKLSDGERFLAWKRLEAGERGVILGPRSAVFAPVTNLGLIIMDEEHEGSYKQETSPRYHAREVASWRAQNEKALFVMGTATPSLETMYRAQAGEIERVDLPTRIDEKSMPVVHILDLKDAAGTRKKPAMITLKLAAEIEANLKRKEGTLLLLNRRGFSTHIHCPQCGAVETCNSCHVSLTHHQEEDKLLCHYCNYEKPASGICSQCKANVLRFTGFGTEKVESEIAARFPSARIARMDTDSVRRRGSHQVILQDFREEKIDILIGTQMIAKGFDFPHVTLVGVILADVGLSLPDFRSAERTFQLLTQVAGRAGRGTKPGRVFIQTYSPDHPSIRLAKHHDYMGFYRLELAERLQYRYPPHTQLINLIVRSRDEKKAYTFARSIRDEWQKALLLRDSASELLGPAPLPFYKLRGHYRWHVMIKSPRKSETARWAASFLSAVKKPSGVAFALDVDPLSIL